MNSLLAPSHRPKSAQRTSSYLRLTVLSAGLLFALIVQPAQKTKIGPLKGFKVPVFFPAQAGQTNHLKSLLMGDEAEFKPNGQIPLKGLRLAIMREDGQTNLVAQTPLCTYLQPSQTASGDRQVQVHSGDGRITIGGDGFFWQETNSILVLSNQVQTRIQQDQPIDIRARRFEYLGDSNQVSYRGQVVVTDPQMEMDAESLAFLLPAPGRSLENAVAETNVVILYPLEHLRATGDHAQFTDKPNLKWIDITGHPTWQHGPREGRADELHFDRLNRSFHARGHTYTKLPRADMDQPAFWLPSPASVPRSGSDPAPGSGLTALSPTNAALSTNQFLEIFADESLLQTNQVAFHGQVQIKDPSSPGSPANMNCRHLFILSIPGSGKLDHIIMDEEVSIRQGDGQITSSRMVFTKTNELAEFTGHPAWISGPHSGQAGMIWFHSDTKAVQARLDATMKLYLGAGAIPLGLPVNNPTTNNISTNRYLLVTAKEYDLQSGLAFFRGEVRAREILDDKPRSLLSSDTLTVKWSVPSNRVERILAEHQVMFEQGIKGLTNGPAAYQKITGELLDLQAANGEMRHLIVENNVSLERANVIAHGDKLDYEVSTDLALLTGHPVVTNTLAKVVLRGSTIIYDHKLDKFSVPGDYHFELTLKSSAGPSGPPRKPPSKKRP